jgi:chaperonin GroES
MFNALENKVIIKLAETGETTIGGLIIPDSAAEVPDTGMVVAVGPGRYASNGTLIPTGIKVGDKVVFERRAAQKIEIEEEEYLVFLSDHILAIVED